MSNLANAVAFLRDPELQSTPLDKRLAFLQSKGLTPSEIEEALRQAGQGVTEGGPPMVAPPLPPLPHPSLLKQSFSWRRLLLMIAVATSAAIALSQSVLPRWLGWFIQRVRSQFDAIDTADSTGWIRESLQSLKRDLFDLKDLLVKTRQDAQQEIQSLKADLEQKELQVQQELGMQRLSIQDTFNQLQSELSRLKPETYHDPADDAAIKNGGLVA